MSYCLEDTGGQGAWGAKYEGDVERAFVHVFGLMLGV